MTSCHLKVSFILYQLVYNRKAGFFGNPWTQISLWNVFLAGWQPLIFSNYFLQKMIAAWKSWLTAQLHVSMLCVFIYS